MEDAADWSGNDLYESLKGKLTWFEKFKQECYEHPLQAVSAVSIIVTTSLALLNTASSLAISLIDAKTKNS